MDSITQAALGAALGGAIAGKQLGRAALVGGALLGTLPDLDVLIDYGSAVANFTQHRGFSHSLLVLVPVSMALAWLLHRWQPQLGYRRALTFTAAILITHPLLDAFTTYGTQLLWPFGPPVAISSMFIIDPLYTLPLLAAVAWSLWRPQATLGLVAALALSTGYLGWSLLAQQLVNTRVEPVLAAMGASQSPRLVQPMPLSTLLWRVTVMEPERRLEIVTGFLDGDIPLNIETFPASPELATAATELTEGERLAWFTRGFLDYRNEHNHHDGDRLLTATDIRLGVPGAHPFTFVLAKQENGTWVATSSYRTAAMPVSPTILHTLWQRLTGEQPVLCLASLQAASDRESCG